MSAGQPSEEDDMVDYPTDAETVVPLSEILEEAKQAVLNNEISSDSADPEDDLGAKQFISEMDSCIGELQKWRQEREQAREAEARGEEPAVAQ